MWFSCGKMLMLQQYSSSTSRSGLETKRFYTKETVLVLRIKLIKFSLISLKIRSLSYVILAYKYIYLVRYVYC